MQKQEMRKLSVVAVFGPIEMTRFMQDADLFESFKVVAKPYRLTLTLKPGCTNIKALSDMRNALEEVGQRVAAMFIPSNPEGAWRDEKILSISDGTKWCTLDSCLEAYDFVAEG